QLDLVSHHPVLDEFLASRGPMYAHDRERYGQYFSGGDRPFEPTRYKPDGTTQALHSAFETQLGTHQSRLLPDVAKPIVEATLSRRDDRAITYALFSSALAPVAAPAAGEVRRAISQLYTGHYLDFEGAN